jgi:hypothetical protein
VEQAQRLCSNLNSAGKNCELLVIPKAGHVFNVVDAEQGRIAWEKTIQFLGGHLKKTPPPQFFQPPESKKCRDRKIAIGVFPACFSFWTR